MDAPRTDSSQLRIGGYEIDILVQGFPGKTVCHGGLGWSTVALVRDGTHVLLVDAGSFNMRGIVTHRLADHGLRPSDVTDVILTHAHYDHSVNWPMFRNARIFIGADELAWAVQQPIGHTLLPEFYVRELDASPQLRRVRPGDEVIPGLSAYAGPGHTPGHLVYLLSGRDRDVVFSGDAAKNRVEVLCRSADMTMDEPASVRTIELVWDLWQRRPGSVLVPGHDVPMVLEGGRPRYIAERTAGIRAWFGEKLDRTTLIELKLP